MKYFVSLFIYILLNNYCTYGPEITKHDKKINLGLGLGLDLDSDLQSYLLGYNVTS